MMAYNKAFQAAQAEGGAVESILAILHAAEPPGVKAGTLHRMSFGLDYLLETTGNGRERWQGLMTPDADPGATAGALIEAMYIFSNPGDALDKLGFSGKDVAAVRKAAHMYALTVPDATVQVAGPWIIREMLRYWGWLPFLEAAAEAGAPVPPAKPDGSPSSLTGSVPTTASPSITPSGDSSPRPQWLSGLPLSSGGAESIPAPASPTLQGSTPPVPTAPPASPATPAAPAAPAMLVQEAPKPAPPAPPLFRRVPLPGRQTSGLMPGPR